MGAGEVEDLAAETLVAAGQVDAALAVPVDAILTSPPYRVRSASPLGRSSDAMALLHAARR